MGKYTKLIEKLKMEEKNHNEKLEKLNDEYSKYHFYRKINSYLNPTTNIIGLVSYYMNRKQVYKLSSDISDIYAVEKLILALGNINIKSDISYTKKLLQMVKLYDKDKKDKYYERIENLFTFKKLILINGETYVDKKNICKILQDGLVLDLRESIKPLILKLKDEVAKEKSKLNIEEIEKNINDEEVKKQKIKRYIAMFSDDEILSSFTNTNDFKNFFDYLKEINFYDVDFPELIETLSEKIKSNDKKITEEQLKKTLNEEQLKIYYNIVDIISDVEENLSLITSSYDVKKLSDNYSLEARKFIYNRGSLIDLDVIINDLKQNLMPNIINHKEEVIKIFTYILEIYKEYKENDIKKEELEEILNQLKKIIKKNKSILDYYEQLSDSNKKIFNQIADQIKNNDNSTLEFIETQFSKPYEFYEVFNILKEIKFNIELFRAVISKNIIPDDEFEDLLDISGEIIEKHDNLEYKEIFDKKIQYVQKKEYQGKTLINFLNPNFENYTDEQKKVLQRTLIKLFEQSWIEFTANAHDNELKYISYKKSNGKVVKLKASGFDVNRIRINKYRIGIIQINVCKENNDKLLKKYNIKGPLIILLEPFIIDGADHNLYYDFIVDVIKNNRNKIDNMVNLFSDPLANEEELYRIIESGILQTKEILSKKIVTDPKEKNVNL